MKTYLRILLALVLTITGAQPALADAVIFSGSDVKTLKPNIDLFGNAKILSGTVDPTSSSTSAPVGSLYLNTSTGLSYRKLDSGSSTNWSVLGSGSTSGKNYITNGDAEAGTTGWSTYADAAGSVPVDCTGGSPTVTFTRSTSSPLRGIGSYLHTKDASNRQGEGDSYAFSIDSADKGKPLQIDIDWQLSSGTWAGSVTPGTNSDVIVYVYDVTNSRLIEPAGKLLDPAVTGTNYQYRGVFQASSDSTSYRLCLHTATTSASAYVLKLDNIRLGPQVIPNGAVVTDWQSYTPTGSWSTNTSYTGRWRRVGDAMEINATLSLSGAPTATALSINLPSGFSVDTTKLSGAGGVFDPLGIAQINDSGSPLIAQVVYGSTTAIRLFYLNTGSASGSEGDINATTPVTFGSGDNISVSAKVPIVGWSSNVQMSNDTDTRVVAVYGAPQVPTGTISGSFTVAKFGTVTRDTHASYSTSTGLYTVPVSGWYNASATIEVSGTSGGVSQYAAIQLQQNGSGVANTAVVTGVGSGSVNLVPVLNQTVYASAGDTLGFYVRSTITSPIYGSGLTNSNFSINRVSGPSQIAASETVAAATTGATATVTGTASDVTWSAEDFDTHGAMGATSFTAPVSGKYKVDTQLRVDHASVTTANIVTMSIMKNGVAHTNSINQGASGNTIRSIWASALLNLAAGDTVKIQISSDGTTPTITAQTAYNHLSIVRVGN